MDSNIAMGPIYGVHMSRLIAFARVCTDFDNFDKLVKQGCSKMKLKTSFLKYLDLRSYINEVVNEYDCILHLIIIYDGQDIS